MKSEGFCIITTRLASSNNVRLTKDDQWLLAFLNHLGLCVSGDGRVEIVTFRIAFLAYNHHTLRTFFKVKLTHIPELDARLLSLTCEDSLGAVI